MERFQFPVAFCLGELIDASNLYGLAFLFTFLGVARSSARSQPSKSPRLAPSAFASR